MSRPVTESWEHLFPDTAVVRLSMPRAAAAFDNPDHLGLACVIWDEDLERQPTELTPRLLDFRSQEDQGPYHWAQGPLDVATAAQQPPPPPPVDPPPPPPKPGTLPRQGQVVTTSNLRLRTGWGDDRGVIGVLPAGTSLTLTGGRRRHPQSEALWVRVRYRAERNANQSGSLKEPDRWVQGDAVGWVNAAFVAMPATEYSDRLMPTVTHEWRYQIESAMDVPVADLAAALDAIMGDPRGPLRAGLRVRQVAANEDPHVVVRLVQNSCGGAAGCYYKRSGEAARVDINREYFGTAWFSRVAIHEIVGHGATRCYDHYKGAPDYPRSDYYGIMGNWQDAFGDHQWPDEDDVKNWQAWLEGASPLVYGPR